MPRPALAPGMVLIRVHYSLVSVGTEIASLRPAVTDVCSSGTPIEKAAAKASLAGRYLGLAARHPDKAVRRICRIVTENTSRLFPAKSDQKVVCSLDNMQWSQCHAEKMESVGGELQIITDDSEYGYQVMSDEIAVPNGCVPIFHIKGRVVEGMVSIGVLDEKKEKWLGARTYDGGVFEDRLIFDPSSSNYVTMVVANAGANRSSTVLLESIEVSHSAPTVNGRALSELGDQGWNVGYSAAGEVITVGEGVMDFKVGDKVTCGGAGLANHADYVSVPRNLVCKIPEGCSMKEAAMTTVGTIALQGVRRAAPQLGERICVIGLGLIGQMTAQLLRAAGCRVVGLDLDPGRVTRAKELGMQAGCQEPDHLKKLVNDLTEGRGADRTIITAATKSDAVVNLAMEVTRVKGTVIIVGDVGLGVQRQHFYRKEIDLLMSTSYGPGRYDRQYEAEGQDYPFSYVRWTLNRNMQAFMELISLQRINIEALIDKVTHVDSAPATYTELAKGEGTQPLAVLIHYPEDGLRYREEEASPKITIGGHRPTPNGPLRYALVGAGAFGTCMLVPQMSKRKDRFFLKAVVSRDAIRGGNFARANQVEIFASELDEVLADSSIDFVVISTRHSEHANQVIASIKAGKHVFVEKPLALSWDELDRVNQAYVGLKEPPLVMVGFNRRFAPAINALRVETSQRRSPLIINYRLNGGYIPLDHWIQTAQGGGRNIGEACHMYDLFRSLTAAPVVAVNAAAISPGTLPYLPNDNFCATLTYDDGSVANLVYTALGPKQGLGKERIEVFCDGEAYLVDDFKSLVRSSDNKVLWHSEVVDKGHFEELTRFGDAIAGLCDVPIPWGEIIETTAVSLLIEDQIFGRIYSDEEY
ncbi:MAG: bi-domain-containing oxidoreductase [Desulfobulbaceae bacterium]|nr:bi-domain-containing oxidoreductase [Desulfobulbaceae bacterium]